MADFRSKLTLDGSDFSKTLDDAGKSVNDFQKKTGDASKQVDDLGKTTKKTASELLNEMKTMEGLGRSTSNYRSQLAQMTRQIQDLTINYNQMSNEMKNSDFGREVASQIQELTKNAADMKDQVQDAANSVKLLASDTKNLDAAKSAIEGLSAGFQLFASAGILGEENTEKVVKALAKLKAIESATNAVIKIANILNKDSILMLKIKELQTRAATRATISQTTATGAATVAQKAFNVAAKANPYVLLATAILAVVGALVAFSDDTEEATYEMAEYETAADKMRKQNEKLADSYSKTAGTMISKFEMMRSKWNQLATDMEKDQFVKDNADNFKELGLKIDDAAAAEKAFTTQSAAIIKAFNLRAEAAAYAAEATLQYQEAIRAKKLGQTTQFKAGDKIPESWSEADRQFYSDWATPDKNGNYYFSGNQDLLNMANNKYNVEALQARQQAQEYQEKGIELEQQANDLLREQGLLLEHNNEVRNHGSGGKQGDEAEVGSAAYYSKLITEINNKLQNQVNTKEQILEYEKQIQMLEALRDKALGKEPTNLIPQLQMRTGLENVGEIKVPATLSVQEVEFEDINFNDLNNEISNAIGGLQSMNSAVANVGKSIEDLGEGWDDSKSALENITTKIGDVFSIMQSVCTVIDTMNKLGAIFESIQSVSWMLEKKKNSEESKGLVIKAAGVALSEEEAIANTVGAAGAVGESAGKIPYVGWILAIAAVAGIIAAIASAKSSVGFAKGGIVPGSSFSGDNISAQLNSGEMVLTTGQQSRLFDLLNGSGSVNGSSNKVEFVIKGQELKGVLSNYDKKMSRV